MAAVGDVLLEEEGPSHAVADVSTWMESNQDESPRKSWRSNQGQRPIRFQDDVSESEFDDIMKYVASSHVVQVPSVARGRSSRGRGRKSIRRSQIDYVQADVASSRVKTPVVRGKTSRGRGRKYVRQSSERDSGMDIQADAAVSRFVLTPVIRGETSRGRGRKQAVRRSSERESDVELQTALVSQWTIGSVVWAKVGKYPYWPGLICEDPKTKEHIRQKHLHVTFFDEKPTRAWIKHTNVELFISASQGEKGGSMYSSYMHARCRKAATQAQETLTWPANIRFYHTVVQDKSPESESEEESSLYFESDELSGDGIEIRFSEMHQNEMNEYKCRHCHGCFDTTHVFLGHLIQRHLPMYRWRCPICRHKTKLRCAMRLHMSSEHGCAEGAPEETLVTVPGCDPTRGPFWRYPGSSMWRGGSLMGDAEKWTSILPEGPGHVYVRDLCRIYSTKELDVLLDGVMWN